MAQLFANNAFGSLGATLSAVSTTLTLATGQGARFPTPTGGDHFLLTLVGLDGNGNENAWEIVKVTGRASDALTVVRGQESTTAALWASGTRVEMRATKGTFDGLLQLVGGAITGPVSVTIGAYTSLKVGVTGLVSVGGEAGSAEAKFTITDAGNVGMEFSPTAIAGANRILSYNRASMQFAPMTLMASSHKFNVSGTDMVTVDSTGMTYTGTLTGGTGIVNLGSGQVVKDASGNLGLGVTPSAWVGVTGTMQMPDGGIFGFAGTSGDFVANAYYNGGYKYVKTAAATVYAQTAGEHRWLTAPSGTAGNPISWTQAMMLDSAGNLGLGVTPSAWAAGHRVAEFGTAANSVAALSGGDLNLANNAFLGGSGWVYKISAGATRFQQDFGVSRWLIDSGTKTAGAACNFTPAMTLDASGNLTLSAGAMGYGTGAGGTVTQATSKSTAVTLNKPSGTITMHNASLAAGASVAFALSNTFFGSSDSAALVGRSWSARYRIELADSTSGIVGIRVTNIEGVSYSDPIEISFTIIKGSAT